MNQIKSLFTELGDSNKLSTQRIITTILVVCLVTVVIGNMFFELVIDEFIFSGLVEVTIWSLGFVGAERFSNYNSKPIIKSNKKHTDQEVNFIEEDDFSNVKPPF